MSEAAARVLCENEFNNCPIYNISGKPIDPDEFLDDCAKDVAVGILTQYDFCFKINVVLWTSFYKVIM